MRIGQKVGLNKKIVMDKVVNNYEDDFIYYNDNIAYLLLNNDTTAFIVDMDFDNGKNYYGLSFDSFIDENSTVDYWFMEEDLIAIEEEKKDLFRAVANTIVNDGEEIKIKDDIIYQLTFDNVTFEYNSRTKKINVYIENDLQFIIKNNEMLEALKILVEKNIDVFNRDLEIVLEALEKII